MSGEPFTLPGWIALIGGIWLLFNSADTVASPDVKRNVREWLTRTGQRELLTQWPATFARVFDRLFGERHLSWRCFLNSSVASVGAVLLITVIWAAYRPDEWRRVMRTESRLSLAIEVMQIGLILNLVPDYLSLLETRYVIRWMSKRGGSRVIIAGLLFDTVATVTIALCGFFLFWGIFFAYVTITVSTNELRDMFSDSSRIEAFINVMREVWEWLLMNGAIYSLTLPQSASGNLPPAIWFYSAFFTSVWIWLYAASGWTLRFAARLRIGFTSLEKLLDLNAKPIASLGWTSMFLVTIIYGLGALVWRLT